MGNENKHGLQTLGNGVYAWLAPRATWGWSNAGLIVDGEQSLLVDTLYDRSESRTRRAGDRAQSGRNP